jgi:hypothetical protein
LKTLLLIIAALVVAATIFYAYYGGFRMVRFSIESQGRGKPSVIIGILKVFPALKRFLEEQGYSDGPVKEIYDVKNKRIIYRAEISVLPTRSAI